MIQGYRILLVEALAQSDPSLKPALEASGYHVLQVADFGEQAGRFSPPEPDLIILNLPVSSKLALAQLFQYASAAPVLLISGSSYAELRLAQRGVPEPSTLEGRGAGQAAVLTHIQSLLPKAQAVLTPDGQGPIECGTLLIDLAAGQVLRRGELVRLTRTEWALLRLFVQHAGQLLPHQVLLSRVWGSAYDKAEEYLHTYINRLRRKLEDNPHAPRYLLTQSGIGYRFVIPGRSTETLPGGPA